MFKKLRINSYDGNLEEIRERLPDDEEVVAAVWGAASSGQKRACVLALTDRRIIRYGKRLFGDDLVTLPIEMITTIDEWSGFRTKGINFYFVNGCVSFYPGISSVDKERLTEFMKELRSRMSDNMGYGDEDGGSYDMADFIRKLAELKEDGIITEEEFNSKKQELLERV